ncbi:MAG: hypothetical protein MJE68_25600 [Proteobacteria bacterium]|nr:hypothetical protein [Pseudomonadota bacterium]
MGGLKPSLPPYFSAPALGRSFLANDVLTPTLSREGGVGHFIDTRIIYYANKAS